jgi:hypothetical protein
MTDTPLSLEKFLSIVAALRALHDDALSDGAELEFLCAVATCAGMQASEMDEPHAHLGLVSKWVTQGFLSEDTEDEADDD